MSATLSSTTWRTESTAPFISAVVPVVRVAILRRHEPPLTEPHTRRAEAALKAVWPVWKEKYRAAVAERANVDAHSVCIDEAEVVRWRMDGKTPMIDMPRLGLQTEFDLRNCVALCVHEYSSKFWTRVGPEFGASYRVDELTTVLERYRALARGCGQWFHNEVFDICRDALDEGTILDEGQLEVTTVGLQLDETLTEEEINNWFFVKGRPNFDNEDMCRFFSQTAGIDYDLRDVESREKRAFWMSMPMAVRLRDDSLAIRTALYLVRSLPSLVQVTGIGLDDSGTGDFANAVALKVSRLIANHV